MDLYRLADDNSVEPISQLGDEDWDIDRRRVGFAYVGKYEVSTVFLVLDHGYGGVPMLFETMVFESGDYSGLRCERYSTWAEAEMGHARIVMELQSEIAIEPMETLVVEASYLKEIES